MIAIKLMLITVFSLLIVRASAGTCEGPFVIYATATRTFSNRNPVSQSWNDLKPGDCRNLEPEINDYLNIFSSQGCMRNACLDPPNCSHCGLTCYSDVCNTFYKDGDCSGQSLKVCGGGGPNKEFTFSTSSFRVDYS